MNVSGPLAGYTSNYVQSHQSNSSGSNGFQDALENCSLQDTVDISEQGASLAERMGNIESLLDASSGEGGWVRIDTAAMYGELFDALGSKIIGLLASYGVDASKPIDLTVDSQGMIRVANDHPNKERIEKMFEENPEVRDEYIKISAMGNFLKGAEEYKEFAEEYERDPQAAMKKHLSVFTGLKKSLVCRLESATLNVM
jgi:hypothetical protein